MDAARFSALWERCRYHKNTGDTVAASLFEEIGKHYNEHGRYYHNPEHVDWCLHWFDQARDLMEWPDAVELAIWFHDVIYGTRATDNEMRSAEWFRGRAEGHLPEPLIKRVEQLIMDTVHAEQPRQGDGCFIVDIDLASFGQDWKHFSRDSRNVRRELTHMDDATFACKQSCFFEMLRARPCFFCTPYFRERFEENARKNVQRRLVEASAGK